MRTGNERNSLHYMVAVADTCSASYDSLDATYIMKSGITYPMDMDYFFMLHDHLWSSMHLQMSSEVYPNVLLFLFVCL